MPNPSAALTSIDERVVQLPLLEARRLVDATLAAAAGVLRGQDGAVRLLIASVLARGHVLLEDVPGVGKTTLARAVARLLGDSFSRIQFTADLLPADVLGVQVLDAARSDFVLRRGPIFAQVVLADEINRASPKTQSAMLEAMAEGAVTIDETTHALPDPFVVIATQNPVEHHGAYPLPESQLDRFAVSLSLGYPSRDDERALLLAPGDPERKLAALPVLLDAPRLRAVQARVDEVGLSAAAADYLLSIVEGTRRHADVLLGCSPRGALMFGALARAWAFIAGRDFVLPDDVKHLAVPALAHRLVVAGQRGATRREARALVESIVAATPAPR